MEIKELKKSLYKDIKHADEHEITVKVYDCDESGEQTYDVEVTVYVDGEYYETYVTNTFYEGGEKDAMKRARAVRTSLLKDFEDIKPVTLYTM